MYHDPAFRRRQMALRFFTYGVMTVAVVVISIICILFVLGYRFDQSNGKIEQQALLQLRSFPSSAAVVLDGTQLSFRTPGKRTLAAGQHTVSMRLDGYREWKKTVTLHPGSLLWLNYARLVPSSITTDEIHDLGKLTSMKASPDRRWLALSSQTDGKPTVTIGDISNTDQPKFSTLTLPQDALKIKGKLGKLELIEWDFGGRYLLARHTVAGKTEFLQIDRTNPTEMRNVNRQLKIPLTEAHFAGTSGTTMFVLSDGDIRKIDLAAGTISRPLVSDVKSFTLYKSDTIAFASYTDGIQKAGIYKDGDKEPTIVRTFRGASPAAQVSVSNYFSDDYLAVAHGKQVEIIKDPTTAGESAGRAFANFTFSPGVKWLDFSSSGRFVFAQNGATFASYDLEEDTFSKTTLKTRQPLIERLQWLDDFYLTTSTDKTLRLMEFDGTNQQIITDVVPGFDVTLSENGEQLFTVGKNEQGKYVLQRSRMVLK